MSQFHLPYANNADPEQIEEIIREHALATLILTVPPDGTTTTSPFISYIPFLFNREENTLRGHISKANPIARLNLDTPYDCIAIFHGPNGYISPAWYESKKEHGKAVPTWNYITVHVKGKCYFRQEPSWIYQNVSELSDHFEKTRNSDWKITDAPPVYIDSMMRAIIGIEIIIEQIDGKFKLSQNRSPQDRKAVIENLQNTNVPSDRALAEWVEKVEQKKKESEV